MMTSNRIEKLRGNRAAILERVAAAATQAQRDPTTVKLVGVTKYVDAEVTRDLIAAGCVDCGENRPQAFWAKAEALQDLPVRWHQIGHLQRNKLKRTLPHTHLVHSVDSTRLLEAIDNMQVQQASGQPQAILLEVNVSGDQAKHGFTPDAIDQAVARALELEGVSLQGLMCMAGWGTSPDEARRDFAKLRKIREKLSEHYPADSLREMSMGMSGDFEQAIAEGATLVRVGSALFEGVD